MKYILVLFYIGCIWEGVCAQAGIKSNFSTVQYHYFLGSVIKHTPQFIPNITENTQLHELSFNFSFNNQKKWLQTHRYPKLSFSLIYVHYGDEVIFGDSYDALVGLNYTKQHPLFERHLNLKFGLNYSTKPYNRFTNPTNNAIGSKLNLTVKIDFGYAYKLTEKLHLLAFLSVKHHSNGRVETPNKGLNILGGQVGLQWNLANMNQTNNPPISDFTFNKKHQFIVSLGYGRHELVKEYNGPKYPVYIAGLYAQKRLNALLSFNYGVEYVYFKSAYHAIVDNAIVPNKPHWHASKISPYVGLDVLYGRFAIAALLGFYPYSPILTAGKFPTKFGFKYYVQSNDSNKTNSLFVAGYLKTHFAVAEYLEFSVGYRFGGKGALSYQ